MNREWKPNCEASSAQLMREPGSSQAEEMQRAALEICRKRFGRESPGNSGIA
jgi:hypothetical protein